MALSLQDPTLALRRFFHSVSVESQAAVKQLVIAYRTWLMTQGGKPQLQVKEFTNLTGTTTVIADAACKIYAIIVQKTTTTAASFKGTDNATTGSATAFAVGLTQTIVTADVLLFPKGLPMANGFAILSNTTMAGNTTSAAGDGAKGVVLLGSA